MSAGRANLSASSGPFFECGISGNLPVYVVVMTTWPCGYCGFLRIFEDIRKSPKMQKTTVFPWFSRFRLRFLSPARLPFRHFGFDSLGRCFSYRKRFCDSCEEVLSCLGLFKARLWQPANDVRPEGISLI